MSWRVLTIQNNCRLSFKNRQILIENDDKSVHFPCEDLLALVLDSPKISLTSSLISKLHENNVVIISCDEKHTPNGISTSFHGHSRQAEISLVQINVSLPLKKRIWKKIIQQKISNQYRLLKFLKKNEAEKLKLLIGKVESGDKNNIEALAARIYWNSLFGESFNRQSDNIINACLNYGYSIIRSLIARSITSYGLIPSLGIFHKNQLNPFNLADDIIEPFRPIIDYLVFRLLQDFLDEKELIKEMKLKLIEVSLEECFISNEIHVLHNASDKSCMSLVTSFRKKSEEFLELPEIKL
jgi:CRISP-associated protein Cas1